MVGLKKILSLLVVFFLVSGGVTLFGAQTAGDEEGELIDKVNVKVVYDLNEGIGDVYEGEIDLFLHRVEPQDLMWPIPRPELETWEARTSYSNLFINPSHEGYGTQAMEDAIDASWIEEPEEIQWLANNVDGTWTVNPFAHNDIRFAMQYLSREKIAEELLIGYADPRYSFMDVSSDVWQDHFVEAIEEKYEMSPEGNEELIKQMIEDAMLEIQEEVAFGEVRHDGDHWQYRAPGEDWHDIEIIIMSRVEDWRLDLGYYFEEILQDLGFDAWVDPVDSTTAIPRAFFGDPDPYDDLAYHIYTGGWISSQAEYYQEAGAAQMYAPWYGFTQTHVEEERWNYDEEGYTERVQRLDNISKRLFQGEIESEEEYWEKKVETVQIGFEESLRVFLLTRHLFYVYNPDTLLSSVPESISGYDTYFGPRTMRTDDGTLGAAVLTGVDRPYMDNWNVYGGSRDVDGEYQRRMLREYGSWMHPQTGLPMEVNVYWSEGRDTDPYERRGDVEMDYEWVDDELVENIEIPEDALDYVPGIKVGDEWEEVGEWWTRDELIAEGLIEDEYAAVKATLDVHEEHVWHDGTDFTLRDVMANYAREKRLTCPSSEPYLSSWEKRRGPWYDTIHAIEWDEQNGTYTVYGNYTLPIEDKIGDHYAMFPEVHPLTYEGWDHMHGQTEIWEISDVEETYHYEPGVADNWIHQLSPAQREDLAEVLQTMIDEEYLPCYLDEDRGAPIPADFAEIEAALESLIYFIEQYEHSYISVGPFYMEEYDTSDQTMDLERWDDYGYPFQGEEAEGYEFEYGYWSEQFDISEIRLDHIEEVDPVALGDPIEARGEGHYAQSYPFVDKGPLTEDNMEEWRFTLRRGLNGEILVEVREEDITLIEKDTYSIFEATIPTTDVDRGGHYSLQLEARGKDELVFTTIDTYVIVYKSDVDLNVISSDVDSIVTVNQIGNIWVKVENEGEEDDTAKIALIDDADEAEVVYEEEVPAGEIIEIDYDHTFTDYGTFIVELRDGEDRYVGELGEITVLGADVEALTLDVEPTFGEKPLDVNISMSAENHGTEEGMITLKVDGDALETYEVGAGQAIFETVEYTFEEDGEYSVTFGELQSLVTVVESPDPPIMIELVTPDIVVVGDTETIEVSGESLVEETTVHLYVDGKEVHEEEITEEGEFAFIYDHTFKEAGEIDIEVRDEEGNTVDSEIVMVLDLFELTVNKEGDGFVEVDPDQDEYEEGTEVSLTAVPDESWSFVEWSGDAEGTEESISIVMNQDYEVTAVFEEIPAYELVVDIDGEGEVVVEPEREEYKEGTEVTLTAVPDEGWHFVEWTGDHEGTDEQITMIIEDDMYITAVFEEEIEYYELTVNVEGEGTVEVEPDQDDYEAGTEVTLTAVPDEDWYFEEWSGDETSTEVDITVIMDEDKTITALFEKLSPAEFEFSALTVEPEKPEVGDDIKISVDVTNVGELEGEYTVEFYVNHALIDEIDVELEAGETKTVSTSYEIEEDGEYHIEAEDASLTFTVEEEEEVTTDGWLIAALIISIIALLVLVWRRMQSDEKTSDKNTPEKDNEEEENDEED